MKDQQGARVLVVDDDESLTEVYATWLAERYAVETATSGAEALDVLDEDVAVVLLDRRMPDLPGEAVLETIREEAYDCRVAMVTGVRPDTEVVDMGFDDYVVKPVGSEELKGVVERLLERQAYDDRLQEYYALASKRATLQTELAHTADPDELRAAIDTLDARLETLQAEMTEVVESFEFDDFRVAFRDIAEADDD